jgi:hypothetical protein
MKQEIILKHEFVDFIPDELEERTIYVSIRFATASHLCCCGCGNKVVTPIRPTDWKLIFDGKTVSLNPSIGNWSFACRSHYWIRNNRAKWAPQWTRGQIERGRLRDGYAQENYFSDFSASTDTAIQDDTRKAEVGKPKRKFWRVLKKWF